MASQWESNPAISYADYFRQHRPDPPPDECYSVTLSTKSNSVQGNITRTVVFTETSTLSRRLTDTTTLDIAFINQVLSSSGPVIDPLSEAIYWQWATHPKHVPKEVTTEQDYYPWLEWAVFGPALHAVAAVRDQLYAAAAIDVPQGLRGVTQARCVNKSVQRGSTDIVGELGRRCFAAHEVKRSRVLLLKASDDEDVSVLQGAVELAQRPSGFSFRDTSRGLEDKVRKLMRQVSQIFVF